MSHYHIIPVQCECLLALLVKPPRQGSTNRTETVNFKKPIWKTVKIMLGGCRAPQPNCSGVSPCIPRGPHTIKLSVPGTLRYTHQEIQASDSNVRGQRERQRKTEGEGCSIPA